MINKISISLLLYVIIHLIVYLNIQLIVLSQARPRVHIIVYLIGHILDTKIRLLIQDGILHSIPNLCRTHFQMLSTAS